MHTILFASLLTGDKFNSELQMNRFNKGSFTFLVHTTATDQARAPRGYRQFEIKWCKNGCY